MSDLRLLAHRDPSCSAGFSVLLDASLGSGETWDDLRPTRVHVRCWTCDTLHVLNAAAPTTDREEEYEGDLSRIPREQRPYVWGGDYPATLRTLAAALPAQRLGRVQLHAERRTGFGSLLGDDDVYEWLVTDADGNVLGAVMRYRGGRGGVLFRCGLLGQGQLAEGFRSPAAAAKRVAQEALAARV